MEPLKGDVKAGKQRGNELRGSWATKNDGHLQEMVEDCGKTMGLEHGGLE
jgi:hypothetical protein